TPLAAPLPTQRRPGNCPAFVDLDFTVVDDIPAGELPVDPESALDYAQSPGGLFHRPFRRRCPHAHRRRRPTDRPVNHRVANHTPSPRPRHHPFLARPFSTRTSPS